MNDKVKIEKREVKEIPQVPQPKKFKVVETAVDLQAGDVGLDELIKLYNDPDVESFTFTKVKRVSKVVMVPDKVQVDLK